MNKNDLLQQRAREIGHLHDELRQVYAGGTELLNRIAALEEALQEVLNLFPPTAFIASTPDDKAHIIISKARALLETK